MKALLSCLLVAAIMLAPGAFAAPLTLRTVTVGDSGNEPDQNGLGKVDYVFEITDKHITNDVYARFLNAVDAYGTNVRKLYNERMSAGQHGGLVFEPGAKPGEKYRARDGMEERPIYYVNWVDAARFCNWLANGSKIGSSTELGSYNLIKSRGQITPRTRNASYWIPDANEIYKAANYMPTGLWRSVAGLLGVERTQDERPASPAIQLQSLQNRVRDIVDVEIPAALQQLVSSVSPASQPSNDTPVFEALSDPQVESGQKSFYVATNIQERSRNQPYADGLPAVRSFANLAESISESGDETASGNLVDSAFYVPPPPSS